MKSKFIENKKIDDGFLSVIEFTDFNNKLIGYSIIRIYMEHGVIGGGTAKVEDLSSFETKEEAVNFLKEYN